jgi:hypothetical protein
MCDYQVMIEDIAANNCLSSGGSLFRADHIACPCAIQVRIMAYLTQFCLWESPGEVFLDECSGKAAFNQTVVREKPSTVWLLPSTQFLFVVATTKTLYRPIPQLHPLTW